MTAQRVTRRNDAGSNANRAVQFADETYTLRIELDCHHFEPPSEMIEAFESGLAPLRGKVASLQAKRAAGSDARHTTGALFVKNRLKVRPPEQSGDQVLTKRIGRAISRDPYVDRSDIRIAVVNGTVHLYGVVNSPWENTRLQEIVSRVSGVLAVEEHLVENYDGVLSYHPFVDDDYFATNGGHYARRPTSVSDRQIAREIRNDLWWSPYVDARIVNVSVDNGTAVLTGQVATWQQKRLAARNAYDGGAVKVVNRLQVVGRR